MRKSAAAAQVVPSSYGLHSAQRRLLHSHLHVEVVSCNYRSTLRHVHMYVYQTINRNVFRQIISLFFYKDTNDADTYTMEFVKLA